VPKDWIGTPVTLCSHSSIGWNGCSSLNRAFQTDPAVDHMTVHYVKGEDVTLWLVGEYADFRGPRQQIGVIPAEVLLAHPDSEIDLAATSDRPDGVGLAAHLTDGTGTRDWIAVQKYMILSLRRKVGQPADGALLVGPYVTGYAVRVDGTVWAWGRDSYGGAG